LLQSFRRPARLALGGAIGACAWPLLHLAAARLPEPLRFLLGWLIFTFGPGIAVGGALGAALDPLQRAIVILGVGTAATPVVIDVLGRAGLISLFPFVACALAGAGLAVWRRSSVDRRDAAACAWLALLAAVTGAIVFWHRLLVDADGIRLFGEYDTADMSWYAVVASEATHTIPPMASYYSGHALNGAYFPQLVLAMVHRFFAVPILAVYFRYAYPTFVVATVLCIFALVRAVASRRAAVLSAVLILLGSDFSYLAAWFLPHAAVDWDYVLWPTNFLSSTMQIMHFSTWSPTLPLFFTALFAIVHGLQVRSRGWLALAGFMIGMLFEFKPFAWVVLMGALGACVVFARGGWAARRPFVETIAFGVLFSLPFLWRAATLAPADRRTRLLIQYFLMPKRMLIKIDMVGQFADAAARIAPVAALRTPIFLLMATVVFLAVGIGMRWLGAPGAWRAIVKGDDSGTSAGWRLLAWCVVAGILVPFVLTTEPYVDTAQFYFTGLFVMWIFAAAALAAFAEKRGAAAGAAAIAATLVLAFPSSGHYLLRRWTDRDREPRAALTRPEMAIADYLRTSTDPETTVILHDRPLTPSLTAILSERRIVLGWDVRYSAVGGEGRLREVNRFYGSAAGSAEAALDVLRHYQVTHVIIRPQADRVHADVVARLKPILQFPDVVLYEVPPL